jgi:hypothetical protein
VGIFSEQVWGVSAERHQADTVTVTVQGFKLRLDTTSKGWGLLVGHQWGLSHGHQWDFLRLWHTFRGADVARVANGIGVIWVIMIGM